MRENREDFTIITECPCCGKVSEVSVNFEDYLDYEEGKAIQECFPYLTADERELMKTGMCKTCWDKLFGEDDDDPECDCEFITEDEESEEIEPIIVELMNIHSEFTRIIEEVEKDFIGSEQEEGYMDGLERAKEVVEERIWALENKLISQ